MKGIREQGALSFRECEKDPIRSFDVGILEPLCTIHPSHPCVILIDGIDEALHSHSDFSFFAPSSPVFASHSPSHSPGFGAHNSLGYHKEEMSIPLLLQRVVRKFPPWLKVFLLFVVLLFCFYFFFFLLFSFCCLFFFSFNI